MSDTPQTDAIIAADLHNIDDDECAASAYWRLAELARSIERALDNAKSDARQGEQDTIRALHERNEVREQLDRLAEAARRLLTAQIPRPLGGIIDQADRAKAEADTFAECIDAKEALREALAAVERSTQ